ncbi:MAG: putative porin [Deltaproteobacteria bacterium]|nr:putative porin [Deltaproteobacteria bacterium]
MITRDQETRKKEIKQIVSTQTEQKAKEWRTCIPEWVSRVKVLGDLRLRYEGICNRFAVCCRLFQYRAC